MEKDEKKEKQKKYYEENKEKLKQHQRETYYLNREEISQKRKEFYKNNKDKIKKNTLKYYHENKEVVLKKQLEYQSNKNYESAKYKLTRNIRSLFCRTLKYSKNIKNGKFEIYTNIPISEYIEYFENNYPLEFSQITEKNKYHIDHIIPCSCYDFSDDEEIKKCWNPHNLRIIPSSENFLKSSSVDYDLIKLKNIEHLLPKNKKCEN